MGADSILVERLRHLPRHYWNKWEHHGLVICADNRDLQRRLATSRLLDGCCPGAGPSAFPGAAVLNLVPAPLLDQLVSDHKSWRSLWPSWCMRRFNGYNDAATCALATFTRSGYMELVSYGRRAITPSSTYTLIQSHVR
jgi:hypothetical protein